MVCQEVYQRKYLYVQGGPQNTIGSSQTITIIPKFSIKVTQQYGLCNSNNMWSEE